MDRAHQQDGPVEDLRSQLRDEPGTSPTDTLLAAVKAGPPPERAWLVEEMARRDRQTAQALQTALDERAGSHWLHDELAERAAEAAREG